MWCLPYRHSRSGTPGSCDRNYRDHQQSRVTGSVKQRSHAQQSEGLVDDIRHCYANDEPQRGESNNSREQSRGHGMCREQYTGDS